MTDHAADLREYADHLQSVMRNLGVDMEVERLRAAADEIERLRTIIRAAFEDATDNDLCGVEQILRCAVEALPQPSDVGERR